MMKKHILTLLIFFVVTHVVAQNNPVVESISYLRQNSVAPDQYVIQKFSRYDIVILGEDHAIKNNLDFVKTLLPKLYRAGVTNLGMEFGSEEMQPKVDSLMNAPAYNDQLVRDIMYFHNAAWAYADYLDIYKAVWEFNRTLGKNDKKFRVLHLSYQYAWKDFEGEMTPEKRKKVFHKGGDEFWANKVKHEVIARGEKVLCLVGVPHAFARYHQAFPDRAGKCKFDSTQFAQHLYKQFPDKVFSILLGVPLISQSGMSYNGAGNGAIDLIMHNLGNRPAGFDLAGTPMGDLRDSSMFSLCHDGFTLKDFFDGYIFLAPLEKMTGSAIDPLFFSNRSWDEVLRRQPDPYWFKANNEKELLDKIAGYADLNKRYNSPKASQFPTVTHGIVQRFENFASAFVSPRNVDVWLPDDYSPSKKYSVLYMHDGQMLYDSSKTWNHSAWDVDDTVARLLKEKKIRNVIVVGIWNAVNDRHVEYFPEKAFNLLSVQQRDSLFNAGRANGASVFSRREILSDEYLKFIVTELKPHIDRSFSTFTDREHTFIAGSSMGGLISLYAICEYPLVFGGAACLSTHWPGVFAAQNNPVPAAFFKYMKTHLPDPSKHKIYFDYGDQTLDALYPPLQKQVDEVMKARGFTAKNWLTKYWPGDDHSELSWRRRLHVPIEFLLR